MFEVGFDFGDFYSFCAVIVWMHQCWPVIRTHLVDPCVGECAEPQQAGSKKVRRRVCKGVLTAQRVRRQFRKISQLCVCV